MLILVILHHKLVRHLRSWCDIAGILLCFLQHLLLPLLLLHLLLQCFSIHRIKVFLLDVGPFDDHRRQHHRYYHHLLLESWQNSSILLNITGHNTFALFSRLRALLIVFLSTILTFDFYLFLKSLLLQFSISSELCCRHFTLY
jgi:hypothetical protein